MSTARSRMSSRAASISARVAPSLQCQATDQMRAGYSGDVTRRGIETNNGPLLRNGLIAAPRDQPQAASRIEIKLDAAKMGRQAHAQSLTVASLCVHNAKNASRRAV